jgi:trk system potassium uptake protein TrkA
MINNIKNGMTQFAVIGLGRFGSALTKNLYQLGMDVLAIDINEERVNNISEYATHTITADASEESVLKAVGISNFDAVVICIGDNMQASILITLMCKDMGVSYVIAKAQNEKHKTVLNKIGADYVIVPEEDMAEKLATILTNPHLHDMMALTDNYSIIETTIPDQWIGESLIELDFRKKHSVNILIIKRGNEIISAPTGETTLQKGDILVVGGLNIDIKNFNHIIYNKNS